VLNAAPQGRFPCGTVRSGAMRVSKDVVSEEVEGQAVLLHLTSGTYFRLNATGTRLWAQLERGLPLEEVYGAFATEFGGEPAQYRVDGEALVAELLAKGLVCQP
jgi:hypothetical protein